MSVEQEERLRHLVAELKARGHRVTPQRLAVIDVLLGSDSHPSIEEIYEELRDSFPTMSLATVYKTIQTLKEMGEVMELGATTGRNRNDGRRPQEHTHLVCTGCGVILGVDLDPLTGREASIALEAGFRLTGHRFELLGLCPTCQKRDRIPMKR
ncbi:MAG: Fur family transcriptional regulator [Dehalococcoidia bacterium]